MVSFEVADIKLEDQDESIEYVRFLDDNDPRLLLIVTYHQMLKTTYFKVAKIEKSRKYFKRHIVESEGRMRVLSILTNPYEDKNKPRRKSIT